MTKSEFISRLDDHYAARHCLAITAKHLIQQMVEESGDMTFAYLYGTEYDEDADIDWCWLEDWYVLHSIYIKDSDIIVKQKNENGCYRDSKLDWLNDSDLIEISDFLCRR